MISRSRWISFITILVIVVCLGGTSPLLAQGLVQLTNDPAADTDPAWSPDGSEIAFASERTGASHLWALRPDGTGLRRITPDEAPGGCPSWSPDSSQLVYWSDVLRIINRDGTGMRELPVFGITPAWSPDGTRIAFAGGPAAPYWPYLPGDIYIINVDGSRLTQVTFDDPGQYWLDSHPNWSPDGSEIVFCSNRGGDYAIWAIRPDGTGLRYITPLTPGLWSGEANCSPDGQWISFESTTSGDWSTPLELWAVDPNGGNLRRLTLGGGYDGTWSPDSSHIAFTSNRAGSPDIWLCPSSDLVMIDWVKINRGHGLGPQGDEYYGEDFWVRASTADGWSNISSIFAIDTAGQVRPGPTDRMNYSWNDGAYIRQDYWDTLNWFAAPPPPPGQYTVVAQESAGNSDTLVTAPVPAVPPVHNITHPLNGSVISDTTPTFSWDAVPGASYYCLCLEEAGHDLPRVWNRYWGNPIPGGATSVAYNEDGQARDPQLTPGSKYRLHIVAWVPEDFFVSDPRVELWSFTDRTIEFWVAPKPEPIPGLVGKIAYEHCIGIWPEGGKAGELYMMSLSDPELTSIPLYALGGGDPEGGLTQGSGITWSPDGTKLAFSAYLPRQYDWEPMDIFVINSDSTGLTNITNSPAMEGRPQWCPDGRRILYIANTDFVPEPGVRAEPYGQGYDMYTMNPDGTDQQRLTYFGPDAGVGELCWSPDGAKIVFDYIDPTGQGDIAVINADGTGFTKLTDDGWWDWGPNWSPDGKTIVFHSDRDLIPTPPWPGDRNELYRIDPDGSNLTRLTYLGGGFCDIDWSPDGRSLVVAFTPGSVGDAWESSGNVELYILSADGSSMQRLTYNFWPNWYPSWWGPNTSSGSNVSATICDTTITFQSVEGEGVTSAVVYTEPPGPQPEGFQFLGEYYNIETTATVTGNITIAIHYEESEVPGGQEAWLMLLHYDETLGRWVDITTSIDTANNIIYGQTTHLSSFGIASRPRMEGFLQPINMDGSSVFKRNSTIPVKLRLYDALGNPITNATIRLYAAQISNSVTGTFIEALATNSPDAGNTFRYDPDSQQYIFNLGTRSLTTGTWRLKADLAGLVKLETSISLK